MSRQADVERESLIYCSTRTSLTISNALLTLFGTHISLQTSLAISKAPHQFCSTFIHGIISFSSIPHHTLQAQQHPALFERWSPRPESQALHQKDASELR